MERRAQVKAVKPRWRAPFHFCSQAELDRLTLWLLRSLFSVRFSVWPCGDQRASRCTAAFAIALTTIIFTGLLSEPNQKLVMTWSNYIKKARLLTWRGFCLCAPGKRLGILINRYTNTIFTSDHGVMHLCGGRNGPRKLKTTAFQILSIN